MGMKFINGTKLAISTTLGNAVAVSAVSNANPGVASAAVTPAAGGIVVMSSGWSELEGIVARAASVVANTSFALEGINTTDVARYPAGEGAGTYQLAGSFVALSQIIDVKISGGETNFHKWQYVEDPSGRERQAPTNKSAISREIILHYDASMPWFAALKEADRKRQPVVLRETLPDGAVIYSVGYLSFQDVPVGSVNEGMTVTATFSLLSAPTRY